VYPEALRTLLHPPNDSFVALCYDLTERIEISTRTTSRGVPLRSKPKNWVLSPIEAVRSVSCGPPPRILGCRPQFSNTVPLCRVLAKNPMGRDGSNSETHDPTFFPKGGALPTIFVV